MEQATNASLIPTAAMDLLLVFPRLAQRAGNFALFHMPEAVDNIAGKIFHSGSVIADATGKYTADSTITNTSNHFAQSTAAAMDPALGGVLKEMANGTSSTVFGTMLNGFSKVKSFGGIISYLTSRWSIATFIVAIILNRTQFYASTREHLRLRWYVRLALYATPICAFLIQLVRILQALRCQTSPDFALLRYGDPLKNLSIDFGGDGGFLHKLSSTLLFWEDDMHCCAARNMSLLAVAEDRSRLRGTMSLLFGFFLTLCTSQFFETLSCALQGKQPMPETGLTIFEHSLAFAECEAMISSALGFGFFGQLKPEGTSTSSQSQSSGPMITRTELLQRLNVPPEVLLVCIISCFSHISSAVLAITGRRHKVRLLNTGFWACCYMSAFVWCFARAIAEPAENVTDLGILRFPTVCIVGFIPHLLVLMGIVICGTIYGAALVITALSVPDDVATELNLGRRMAWAYQNLQANVQFSASSNIRIRMSEDFYTTLLKVGFATLTAASEAVYLNEGNQIRVANMTWLEQKRIGELAAGIDKRSRLNIPSELLGEGIAKGVGFVDQHNTAISSSPYARERKSTRTKSDQEKANMRELDSGLGLAQRRNRMQLTFDFMAGMSWLITNIVAQMVLNGLRKIGISYRPRWLSKIAGPANSATQRDTTGARKTSDAMQDFYYRGPDGRLIVARDGNIDVEAEIRKQLMSSGKDTSEESVSDNIYGWWRRRGWFGDVDSSGDYQAPALEDDTTSVVSFSTNADTNDEWSDDSGRRTPTQFDPVGSRSRESTTEPDEHAHTMELARLLNPQTAADREEARILSHSLNFSRPMTRSQYRRSADRQAAQVLAGIRGARSAPLSEEEEEQDLERFILEQREKSKHQASRNGTWEAGGEGMGDGGPSCVICQSSPRSCICWPCGCLTSCDDCRMGLATRNYSKCICCRADVVAFSRLFVP